MKLSDVVNRINGNVDRFTTDLEYYVGGEHFDSNELAVNRKGMLKENLNVLGFKFHFAFQKRDVLFMARNPHLRKAGMVMFDGLCSDATYILRSKDENVLLQEYLALQLQSDHFWNYCESHKVGSVNFANNWTSIANYEFDLPSIEEQKVLADKLWAAYRVKEAYRQLLSTTDEMLKAKFQEMLKGARKVSLGDVCSRITDGSHTPPQGINHSEYLMISAKNIDGVGLDLNDVRYLSQADFEKEHKRTKIKKDDVLLTIVGTIGRAYLMKGNEPNITLQRSVAVLTPNERIVPSFLYYSMSTDTEFEKEGQGNAQKGVYLAKLAKYQITLPDINMQKEFASIFTQAEATKTSLRASIEAIDRVIRSLINQ